MSVSPPPTYDAHYRSTTSLKPYLELPHLLSLTWLAYPVLSILFVAFRLQLSLASAQDDIVSVKADIASACQAAQKAATGAASMPRYMATVINNQFVDAVNGSMNDARAALILALTMMEAIIDFIVDIYRSTLLCFVELIIRGALAIVISAVEALDGVVNDIASGIASTIEDSIDAANSAISSVIDEINKVDPFGNISVPQISSPNLTSFYNVSLPSSFLSSLEQLNSSLPSFSQLKQDIDDILNTPFEDLKADINSTFEGISFNTSLLEVPSQNELTFCNDLDTSFVEDLGNDLIKITKIGIILLVLVALVLVGLNCALEWYKWRCQRRHLQNIRDAWMTDPSVIHIKGVGDPTVTLSDYNLLVLHANSSHPMITRIMNQLSNRLHFSPATHINLTWFLHYIFHPPALACFLIGFFGLLSVQLQLIAIRPLEAKFNDVASATAADFSNSIVTSINTTMFNQSATYANSVNVHIDSIQSTVNDGLLGWVNGTTTTLNNTIATFYDDIQNAISDLFNGTLFEQPLQEFLACFIGSKVTDIEDVLTFLNENLQIDLPRVNESALVLSQGSINEISQPISDAVVGNGSNDNSGFVGKVINSYISSLKKERLMFGIFMGLWGVVVLMAICILLWSTYGKRYMEQRKQRKLERDGVDGVDPFHQDQPNSEKPVTKFIVSSSPQPIGAFPSRYAEPSNATEPSEANNGRSWGALFSGSPSRSKPFPPISKPLKLLSFAKPKSERSNLEADEARSPSAREEDRWFTRFTGRFGRKIAEEEEPASPPSVHSSRLNLRISVDRASSLPTTAGNADANVEPHSRWSTSPEVTKVAPWMGMLSPTRRSYDHGPPPGRSKVHLNADVTPDMTSSSPYNASMPLAPPLHHGFNTALAPPLDRHRRGSSIPARTVPIQGSTKVPASHGSSSVTPVTRFLTSNSARRSSNVDPFATPFDDEHRVTSPKLSPFATPFDDEHQVNIQLAPAHHSYRTQPTNPFMAM